MSKNSSRGKSWSGLDNKAYLREGGELSLGAKSLTVLLDGVLERDATFRFRAKGFSMAPFINDGDLVTVSRLRGTPRLGDVVILQDAGKLAVHRVVGMGGKAYLIKGDNAPETDGMIPGSSLLGRVSRVERRGRSIFMGLGPERSVIALLSRRGLLAPLCRVLWPACRWMERTLR